MKKTPVTAHLDGKTALVTGAGRGIGRAVALGLGQAGASLVLIACSAGQLAETRDLLLLGTGVTVNAYRPGGVDTVMQAWIRQQDPGRIGSALHERFKESFAQGSLFTAEHSAAAVTALAHGQSSVGMGVVIG
jgi:NAD(P)-dependent dehydrogenase (short-subunit alcohol dehydrogenase family)